MHQHVCYPSFLNLHVCVFTFTVIATAVRGKGRSQSGLTVVMDGRTERRLLIKSFSLHVICEDVPLRVACRGRKVNCHICYSISNSLQPLLQHLSSSREMAPNSAVNEVCSAVLLTGSSDWPDWSPEPHVSAAHTATVLHQQHLTGPPSPLFFAFPSPRFFLTLAMGQTFVLLAIFSRYPSPNCSDDSRQMAGRYTKACIHRFT